MVLSEENIDIVKTRYLERYDKYGYSPKTLGWVKNRQGLRFDILTSQYNFNKKNVFDIGCGFGDLNKILKEKAKSYTYLGIDLIDELVNEGKKRYDDENIKFITGDFLNTDIQAEIDYCIASGIFNFKLKGSDNYEFIEKIIKKALEISKDGLAFDFLSDKVDYINSDITFHSNPSKIMEIAYKYSKNIIIRNDYMPFEFSLFIFKDDSFDKEDTVFRRYKNEG